MKTILPMASLLAAPCMELAEEKPVVKLWPTGLPQGAVPISADKIADLRAKQTPEPITYVDLPTLTVYRAPAEASIYSTGGHGYEIRPPGRHVASAPARLDAGQRRVEQVDGHVSRAPPAENCF